MTCKVVRIGVFFYGTGNNLYNDEAGQSENGVSNIGKLYRLYPNEQILEGNKVTECQIHVKSIYIEGLGTKKPEESVKNNEKYDYHKNTTSGLAMGALGAQRINQAITQVITIFDDYPDDEYKWQIDVFGFSRGAAMARDFINTINERHPDLPYTFKFVGLFDTVGSFGIAGDNQNFKPLNPTKYDESNYKLLAYEFDDEDDPNDKLYSDFINKNFIEYNFNLHAKSATHIVQLSAQDEYRKNFPLTNIKGAAGKEYALIGAHSDIGGGYPKLTQETLFYKHEFPHHYTEEMARSEIKKIQQKLGKEWQCKFKKITVLGFPFKDNYDKFLIECSKTRQVTDDLQSVSLHLMYFLATNEGVPLEKEQFNNKSTHVTQDLENLETYKNLVTLSPEDANSYQNKATLLKKYAHKSSVGAIPESFFDNPEAYPCRKRKDNIDSSANQPKRKDTDKNKQDMPIREVFSNVPSKAKLII